MIFLISLILAALFILAAGRALRSHPVPFYVGAAVVAVAVFLCTRLGVRFSGFVGDWVWPIFSRSAFATALWAFVMWTGALPGGTRAVKALMPIRGHLSILAGILTLGHNAAYGLTYFKFLFTNPTRLPANQIAAAVCSLVLILIMLPLLVTSFRTVRRRMNGRKWKKLQRWAYGFYGLLYVHVLLLFLPYAQEGRSGYALSLGIYSAVFLGYGVCRVLKALSAKKGTAAGLGRRQWISTGAVAVLSVCLCLTLLPGHGETEALAQAETLTVASAAPEAVSTAETEEAPAPAPASPEVTPVPQETAPAQPEESGLPEAETEEAPAPSQTPAPQETAPTAETPAPAATPAPAETSQPEPQPEATPAPTPQPTVYRDGTFTGTGEGFQGPITVSVTIQNDTITGISLVSWVDDEPYFSDGKTIISRILASQSANVDTVSGATYSSGGIRSAVAAALATAKNG